jgi:hypothetical protein
MATVWLQLGSLTLACRQLSLAFILGAGAAMGFQFFEPVFESDRPWAILIFPAEYWPLMPHKLVPLCSLGGSSQGISWDLISRAVDAVGFQLGRVGKH